MKAKNLIGILIPLVIAILLGLSIFSYINKIIQKAPVEVVKEESINSKNDNDKIEFKFENKIITLEVARSSGKLAEGLMNRTNLSEDTGMLFIFDSSEPRQFWMKNTLISLDIIFLDADLKVVRVHQNTQPNQTSVTYPSIKSSMYVIEMQAGWAKTNSLEIGDQFSI